MTPGIGLDESEAAENIFGDEGLAFASAGQKEGEDGGMSDAAAVRLLPQPTLTLKQILHHEHTHEQKSVQQYCRRRSYAHIRTCSAL